MNYSSRLFFINLAVFNPAAKKMALITVVIVSLISTILSSTDYLPYGKERIQTGPQSQRKYIGEELDQTTGLNYLNARYYNSGTGQFLSQDPVFWQIGQSEDGKKMLINPQLQNSYSYSVNNPITYKDPDGEFVDENGNNSNNYYPGTNITYQQLNPLSVGAAYLGVSREISVGIAGGIAKVFSEASQTTKPLLKEGINLAEQIGEKSYSSFSSLKSAVKKEYQIAKDIDLHHVVEQNKTNIAQFGQEALQNTKNIIPLARDVHRQVSGAYSRSFTSVKGTYSRYRDYVQTLDFNSQYQKGVEIINKITK